MIDILKRVRKLLSEPSRWSKKGNFARDENGHPVAATAEDAVCWCILGAVMHECECGLFDRSPGGSMFYRIIGKMEEELGIEESGTSLPYWNDIKNTAHADVLNLLDRMITNESSRGSKEAAV